MSEITRMFVNGQAMSGGSLHPYLKAAGPCEPVRTAKRYRFYSFGDFPGIAEVSEGGEHIEGELYPISYEDLREHLLPREPGQLELRVIELEDGRGTLSMVVRDGETDKPEVQDITSFGGWRAFRASSHAGEA